MFPVINNKSQLSLCIYWYINLSQSYEHIVNRINYILTCDNVLYGKVLDITSTFTSCLFPRVKVISHLIYNGLGESCCWGGPTRI